MRAPVRLSCALVGASLLLGSSMALAAAHHHRHHRHVAAPVARPIEDLFPVRKPSLTMHPESGPSRFRME